MPALVIIPARFSSTRLPGKPLAEIDGRPMVHHVYERAKTASGVDRVVVATDDRRIADAVASFGGEAMMTSVDCPSGTDRVAEAAARLTADGYQFECVVNVQGDEPQLDPSVIEAVIGRCAPSVSEGRAPMATAARPLRSRELDDPSVVKVAVDRQGYALYFSRAAIGRDREDSVRSGALAHVGLYAFTPDFLRTFSTLSPTPLERAERLEQLRALENGHAIAVATTEWVSRGVDTPEDLDRIRKGLN